VATRRHWLIRAAAQEAACSQYMTARYFEEFRVGRRQALTMLLDADPPHWPRLGTQGKDQPPEAL